MSDGYAFTRWSITPPRSYEVSFTFGPMIPEETRWLAWWLRAIRLNDPVRHGDQRVVYIDTDSVHTSGPDEGG